MGRNSPSKKQKHKKGNTGQVCQFLSGWVGVVEVSVSGPCKTDASELRICFLFAGSQKIPVLGAFCFCRLFDHCPWILWNCHCAVCLPYLFLVDTASVRLILVCTQSINNYIFLLLCVLHVGYFGETIISLI